MKDKAMNELRAAFEDAMLRLGPASEAVQWEDRRQYGDWLAQMYYFLCHATRLLCAAGSRLTIEHDAIHMRMIDHCQQEKTHERMVLKDLQTLGMKFSEFPQYPATAQVYQSQYYLIDYEDPCALFGCVLYLEGYSLHSGRSAYLRAKKTWGDKSCLFLRTHTDEDVGHIDQAFAIIEMCNEKQLRAILWSLKICAFAYPEMLRAIAATAVATSESAKAV